MFTGLIKDLRYGARMLIKNPGFALAAILTLALGVGVNSTVFTWAKSALLDPLPGVYDSRRIVSLHEIMTSAGGTIATVSFPDYRDYKDRNQVFSGVLATNLVPLSMGGPETPERIWAEEVSANYFDVLGVKLIRGGSFLPDEDTAARPDVVISYMLWEQQFLSDPDVVGKTVLLDNRSFTVVGVAPRDFQSSYGGLVVKAWAPISLNNVLSSRGGDVNDRGGRSFQVLCRLRPGVTIEQAASDVAAIAHQLAVEYPDTNRGFDARLFPLMKEPNSAQAFLFPAMGALLMVAGLVLLIACANLANLWLLRGAARQKEIAIRAAVGAGKFRIVRRLLAEALVVSFAGGAVGLLSAYWTADSLSRLIPKAGYPIQFDLRIDFRVILFTVGTTLFAVLFSAVVPALRSSRPDLLSSLKEGGRTGPSEGKSRIRGALVAAQVAFSCVALISAGLLIRTTQEAQKVNPGFNPDNVLVASVDLFAQGYDPQKGLGFYRRLHDELKSAPGVTSVTLADKLPLRLVSDTSNTASIEGYLPREGERINIEYDTVGPDYFNTMQMPLTEGRDFNIQDDSEHTRVVVVNEALVRRYLPGRDPLGKRIDLGSGRVFQIVGVAKDANYYTLNDAPRPYMYWPVMQSYRGQMTVVVRTKASPWTALAPLNDNIHSLDPNLPIFDVKTLVQATGISLAAQVLAAKLLSVFGVLALVLAAVGTYGVIAYAVAQRRREMGIRIALGASRGEMLRLVVLEGMRWPAGGLLIGLATAFVATRLMGQMLIGVHSYDPLTYIVATTVLIAAAALAAYIPARRAANEDPMSALRYE